MRHALVAPVGIEKPAKTVTHGCLFKLRRTAGGLHRRQSRPHFGFGEQSVVAQGAVPLRQVVKRRINSAVAEYGRRGALVGFLPGLSCRRPALLRCFFLRFVFLCVAVGPMRHFVLALFVGQRVRHFQRREDSLLQKLPERLAGNFLHDHGQHGVSRIAVLPLRARWKLTRSLLLEQFEHACIENLRNLFRRHVGILLHQ